MLRHVTCIVSLVCTGNESDPEDKKAERRARRGRVSAGARILLPTRYTHSFLCRKTNHMNFRDVLNSESGEDEDDPPFLPVIPRKKLASKARKKKVHKSVRLVKPEKIQEITTYQRNKSAKTDMPEPKPKQPQMTVSIEVSADDDANVERDDSDNNVDADHNDNKSRSTR